MSEQHTCRIIYDMSEETRIKEAARMREKALHDEASALFNAKNEGRIEGRADERAKLTENMRSFGLTEEQIQAIINK
ncbi:MAG: hypothetical protein NC253_01695 [Ruminococcus sp.]|nr:hypothetical protein [Ruminococcus sp.]MCM1380748.1 hypothetical protein [Muribaculaceae bacterium]MCM1478708.1 hypothetical protein [Muribaculaceae bacterium]